MPPDYFADYEGSGHAQSLPSPGETPYQTPPTSMSRRSSSRRETSSPPMSSSPPPPMPDDTKRHSKDSATDENISIFDPRRFTPTLHANLVSEILSLRRELESKHKFIEDLESSLHSSKTENETLTRKLSHSTKEGRSVKRHLHQLENGTLAALEELAKDRDERKQAAEDLKDKVEKLEKKIKNQEDEEDRTLKLWERDRETWGNQKRVLERKVHVSESRLKNILAELAAEHAAEQEQHNGHDSEDEETRDSGLGNDSDTNSVHSTGVKRTPSKTSPSRKSPRHARNTSNASQRSLNRPYRFSTQSDAGKLGGLSLAEELDFDAGEEDVLDEIDEDEEEDFPEHEVRARRALSHRSSFDSDFKAKRVLGLAPDGQLPTVSETASLHMSALNSPDTEIFAGRTSHDSKTDSTGRNTRRSHYSEVAPEFIYSSVQYVDTGVQFSPPPSPVLTAQRVESAGTFYDDRTETDSAPNSRIQSLSTSAPTPTPFDAEAVNMTLERPAVVMVSAGAQTTDEPLSPPETPKVSQMEAFEDVEGPSYQDGHDKELEAIPEPQPEPEGKVEMFTMGTQTDPLEELMPLGEAPGSLRRNNKPEPLPIPSIAIHPPASAPGSPRETMLPPGTKNVATQTRTEELVAMRSISVQTDEIRIDRRLMKLPPHLLPSAISSSPNSPENIASNRFRSPDLEREDDVDGPTATPKQLSEKVLGKSPLIRSDIPSSPPAATVVSDTETEDRYPGNNDNGPLQPGMEHKIRRPFRGPSLFAGFDSDNEEKQADADDEDVPDIQSAPVPYSTTSFPRRPLRDLRNERSYPKPPTPVPEDKEVSGRGSSESIRQRAAQAGKVTARNSLENARVSKRPPSIRRSALIKGGATAHMQQGSRSRSPSLQSAGSSKRSSIQGNPSQPPPFPIPGRASSRRLFPISKSDGAQSPTPRSNSIYPGRRNQKGKHIARNDSLRKVKSAAVMPRRSKERSRSRSPPAPQRDSGPPPLPQDVITRSQFFYQAHRMSNSQTQPPTTATDTLAAASEGGQPTVIDAIAATMVGEWMWKYVRRRKSFNVAESPEDLSRTAQDGSINVTGNGSRHKRWVWISPYERSVMWSSKQPASGSALLGKSGRKLLIQSVLDVKDDTPLPRNSGIQPFNRSILILTPARALKFTAVSQERHYLWLTALSFLAHSSVGAPELEAIPPVPQVEPESTAASTFSRRAPIRDSVRLIKDKQRPTALSSLTTSRESNSRKGGLLSPTIHVEEPMPDAADAPSIPRYTSHGRKRSMTGPRIPPAPATLRNFTAPHVNVPPCANYSIGSGPTSVGDFGFGGLSQPASLYGNNSNPSNPASPRPSDVTNTSNGQKQFVDTVGTMRMEAFVASRRSNDTSTNGSGYAPSRMRAGVGVGGRARGNTQWSSSTSDPRRSGMIVMDEFDAFDPFKGF